jgi:D-apiose dehydrogenase
MPNRLSVAVAGAGMISRHHLLAWSKLADAQVVAIADPAAERAKARAEEFAVDRIFSDVETMIDQVAPDAIDIASPVGTHVEIAHMAAARGVAILCQKPLATTLSDALPLVEIAKRVPLMVHENWRFRNPYRLARDWIANGRIGEILRFSIRIESSGLLGGPDSSSGSCQSAVRRA